MESTRTEAGSLKRPCKRCQAQDATLISRAQAVCNDCFFKHVSTKFIKPFSGLGKQLSHALGMEAPRKLLIGLSLGSSSTALVDLVHGYVRHLAENGRKPTFDITVVYVEVNLDAVASPSPHPGFRGLQESQELQKYRARFPLFNFECVPLTAVLGLSTIDWSTLPGMDSEQSPTERIKSLFGGLSSTTSRSDVLRLFIRHILASLAVEHGFHSILLGHSTTAIAELTLAETAKGRGFSLPWQTNDGPFTITHIGSSEDGQQESQGTSNIDAMIQGDARNGTKNSVLIYHPLRDLLRKELVTYTTLTSPPLTEIIPGNPETTNSVVSHKDLSIEEVMMRYFAEVEENYPSVVANVARTMNKLERLGTDEERCVLCAMPSDDQGDARWRGEVGDDDRHGGHADRRICYGCKRSVYG